MASYGLRDTICFSMKGGTTVTLKDVVVDLFEEILNVKVSEILCLQNLPPQGIYDVTFISSEVCWNVYERARSWSEVLLVKKVYDTTVVSERSEHDNGASL